MDYVDADVRFICMPLLNKIAKRQFFSGMFFVYDATAAAGRNVQINLSGGNRTVSEEFLNVFNVDAFFQQKGGKGMTKGMGGNVSFYAGQPRIFCHDIAGGLCGERNTVFIEKNIFAVHLHPFQHFTISIQRVKHFFVGNIDISLLIAFTDDAYG